MFESMLPSTKQAVTKQAAEQETRTTFESTGLTVKLWRQTFVHAGEGETVQQQFIAWAIKQH